MNRTPSPEARRGHMTLQSGLPAQLKPYLISIKVVIVDPAGRCLVLKRSPASRYNAGKWDFPGGKLDPGETFAQALQREVQEETCLTVKLCGVLGAAEAEREHHQIAYLFFAGRAKAAPVQLSSEHSAYRWIRPAALPGLELARQFVPLAKRLASDPQLLARALLTLLGQRAPPRGMG